LRRGNRIERDCVFLRGRFRRRWRSWLRGRFRCGGRSRLRSGFWRGGRSRLRFRCGERSGVWPIAMLLRMIRRCNLRKRSRIHPDDIAGRPSYLSAGEVEQRRNEQDVKGGDVNQIPPELRVTHESRKRDRKRDAEYCQANHSSPPCCPPSRRVMTPTRPIPTRFRMSITSMNF
jgi:hypothetical protein